MDNPGFIVAATIGLGSLTLAVLGIAFRPQVFMEHFVRAQPPRIVSIVQIVMAVVAVWAAWHRGSSHIAHMAAVGMVVMVTLSYVTMFRFNLPVFCLVAGIICNLAVLSANGLRMPVPGPCDGCAAHVGDDVAPRLWWLTDRIVLDYKGGLPYSAVSPGDILIAIGFALIAARVWLHPRTSATQ